MAKLPIIIAQGGISSAGRTSNFHSYCRLVFDSLNRNYRQETLKALAALDSRTENSSTETLLLNSLIRPLDTPLFNKNTVYCHRAITTEKNLEFSIKEKHMPKSVPAHWQIKKRENGVAYIRLLIAKDLLLPSVKTLPVSVAGQLPDGFYPEKLYQSKHHPRGLTMTVYGASDALASSGLDWEVLKRKLAPNDIAVYAGSAMSQLDYNGNGGLLQADLLGKRVTSKQCPLGFADMSAAFINAYLLGSAGATGCNVAACATLLYNLEQACNEIKSGKRKIVIIGNSEAPLTPEIITGYSTMGALAVDKALYTLEKKPNWRHACRPFGYNCGFTLAESSQYFILMDDSLALECGASILGGVADVFIHADGYKKSISSPGIGNYLTMARATALGKQIAGEVALQQHSFVQAHGTGTPQNRITESHILSKIATTFKIKNWPVSAVKSYVGHAIGAAAGDQIISTLGAWHHGYIPGIKTIDAIADDVSQEGLSILQKDYELNKQQAALSLINAKGFGGNNATALLLSPQMVKCMLQAKHGTKTMNQWQYNNEKIIERNKDYETAMLKGISTPIYQFGESVLQGSDLHITASEIKVPGYDTPINLEMENPFWSF